MAQVIRSWLICNGRFRVHAINGLGRRKARIVEVEVVETGERFHGSPRRMESLWRKLSQRATRTLPMGKPSSRLRE